MAYVFAPALFPSSAVNSPNTVLWFRTRTLFMSRLPIPYASHIASFVDDITLFT
jgi:hypothetical protein